MGIIKIILIHKDIIYFIDRYILLVFLRLNFKFSNCFKMSDKEIDDLILHLTPPYKYFIFGTRSERRDRWFAFLLILDFSMIKN